MTPQERETILSHRLRESFQGRSQRQQQEHRKDPLRRTHRQGGSHDPVSTRDAAVVKRDADYALVKEKCETVAGDTRRNGMRQAKARYGKR